MFRCIMFTALVPNFVLKCGYNPSEPFAGVTKGEGVTPENAMTAAVGQYPFPAVVTWQPSTGIVFINNDPCGTVFPIT